MSLDYLGDCFKKYLGRSRNYLEWENIAESLAKKSPNETIVHKLLQHIKEFDLKDSP